MNGLLIFPVDLLHTLHGLFLVRTGRLLDQLIAICRSLLLHLFQSLLNSWRQPRLLKVWLLLLQGILRIVHALLHGGVIVVYDLLGFRLVKWLGLLAVVSSCDNSMLQFRTFLLDREWVGDSLTHSAHEPIAARAVVVHGCGELGGARVDVLEIIVDLGILSRLEEGKRGSRCHQEQEVLDCDHFVL